MAEFKYYLNRQGARGPQGPQGEKGFSPDISVEKDTLSEYVLRITNEGGYFLTSNLREHKEDRGGTYIRYDRDTGVMYAGDADYASTEKYGIVRLAREEDLLTQEESLAVSSAILNGYLEKYYLNKVNGDAVTGDVYFRGRTGFTKSILVDGLKGNNETQYLTRSDTSTAIGSLTIPDDDSRLTQGSKEVAYTSDLTGFVTNTTLNSAISNLVTLNTDQTITGAKTLDNSLYVNNPDMMSGAKSISTEDLHCSSIELGRVWTSKNSDYIYANGYRRISAIAKNGVSIPMITCNTAGAVPNVISFGVSDAYDVIIPARAKTYGGKKFLVQGSVTAGDNISIEETTDGIKI